MAQFKFMVLDRIKKNYYSGEIQVGFFEKPIIHGYPAGELAKKLAFGKYGETKQGWNFLEIVVDLAKDGIGQIIKNNIARKKLPRIAFYKIAIYVRDIINTVLNSGVLNAINPNAPEYLEWKIKNYNENRPLILTGKLAQSCGFRIKDLK